MARNVKARNVSLLRCDTDCTMGERTKLRNRTTFMASGRSCVCHSKRCAALMASAITGSELMRDKTHAELWRATPYSGYPKNNRLLACSKLFSVSDSKRPLREWGMREIGRAH